MMTYQEQIKHPKWQKKRLEVLKLHKFTCQVCRAKDEELHVHHPYYKRGAMIWEYDKKELECLCHRCHKDAHAIDEKIKKALAVCREKEKVLAFILSLDPPNVVATPEKRPSQIELAKKRMEEEDAADIAEYYRKHEPLFVQHPHLRPHPNDTPAERSDKFFSVMKLSMGWG